MCGVPIHRADEYLQRLIRPGYRVAVCEQLEDPAEARKRGSKAVVRRDVVRLVTPGTLTEDTLLDAKARNYLTALFRARRPRARHRSRTRSWRSPRSTSRPASSRSARSRAPTLPGELVRLAPGEVIVADALLADADLRAWIGRVGAAATPVPARLLRQPGRRANLKAQLGVADLGGFGSFHARRAGGHRRAAQVRRADADRAARRCCGRRGAPAPTPFCSSMRRAARAWSWCAPSRARSRAACSPPSIARSPAPGARELAARLASPLRDRDARSTRRLDAVGFLIEEEALRDDVRDCAASGARHRARGLAPRLRARRAARSRRPCATASRPRGSARELLAGEGGGAWACPRSCAASPASCARVGSDARDALAAALVDDPPHLKRDGGFVRAGFRAELDEARRLRDDSRRVMAGARGAATSRRPASSR